MFRKSTNLDVYVDWLSEKVNPEQDLTTPELIDSLTTEIHNAAVMATPRVPFTPRPVGRGSTFCFSQFLKTSMLVLRLINFAVAKVLYEVWRSILTML